MTNKAGTGGAPNLPIGSNSSNNQITDGAPQYDANGNLTAQRGVSYTYDPENRMSYFSSVSNGNRTFAYDSQNKRILNWTGSTDQYGNASGYTVYYYGVKGERLGVYNFTVGYWAGGTTPTLQNTPASTETYFGARRLAPLDRLGSARSVNNTASSYYPFGEDKSTNPAIDAWKFGTYWRDSASGLDYAVNRYYSSSLGRFLTPDADQASSKVAAPQSWNRYTYASGDPADVTDQTGLDGNYAYPDGSCPASQATCGPASMPPPGTPIIAQSGPPAPSPEIQAAEAGYVAGTVLPSYLQSALNGNPILIYALLPSGASSATISFGAEQQNSAVISAPTVLPEQFYAGFVNLLINDDPQGALQIAESLAIATTPQAVLSTLSSGLAGVATSTFFAGETPVIGGLEFTTQYLWQSGYNVLNASWTWEANVAWLENAIATGQSFIAGPGGIYTQREINYLLGQGFTEGGGGILAPPVP